MQINGELLMVLLLVIPSFLVMDGYARTVFIARAYRRRYGHGKSWKRAHAHYKTNWTLIQRLLWIPVFKEKYECKFRCLAYQSYIGLVLAISISIYFLVPFDINASVLYVFSAYIIFVLGEYVYINVIARKEGKK